VKQAHALKLLNKLSVTELAQLSNFSKSYISQVKHSKCPPSGKLLDTIEKYHEPKERPSNNYYSLFLQSRQAMGVSPKTLQFYKERLSPFISQVNYLKAARQDIQHFLNSIPPNQYGLSTRHATYRAINTFYRWLSEEHNIPNPIVGLPAPILSKPVLPSLQQEQVISLIKQVESIRDRAIIALFTESGLRLTELTRIKESDIDWDNRTLRTIGKGRKEAYAPFGKLSEGYLKKWLAEFKPNGNVWGINEWGITSMLRRLEATTGLPCNPHTFRRTFACLLRKQGLDCLTIKDLGRWESVAMVERYTRSITFQDSLKFYKGVLS